MAGCSRWWVNGFLSPFQALSRGPNPRRVLRSCLNRVHIQPRPSTRPPCLRRFQLPAASPLTDPPRHLASSDPTFSHLAPSPDQSLRHPTSPEPIAATSPLAGPGSPAPRPSPHRNPGLQPRRLTSPVPTPRHLALAGSNPRPPRPAGSNARPPHLSPDPACATSPHRIPTSTLHALTGPNPGHLDPHQVRPATSPLAGSGAPPPRTNSTPGPTAPTKTQGHPPAPRQPPPRQRRHLTSSVVASPSGWPLPAVGTRLRRRCL
jgi:hypothetical protein